MLDVSHLSVTYKGGKKAVDDISFSVDGGDICAFIGHNGAGKTTTIKAIAGILEFNSGQIKIGGIDISKDPVAAKQITAYIPDEPTLYPHLTGIQYLNFIADIYGVDKSYREQKIAEYADTFELTKSLGDAISTYSHGMKQKTAVISALIHNPKLLVLDEPFVGLDPQASFILKELLKQLCRTGTAIFYSTHVLEVAEKLCDKVVIIRGGRLVKAGDMEEVKGDKSLEDIFMELIDHE